MYCNLTDLPVSCLDAQSQDWQDGSSAWYTTNPSIHNAIYANALGRVNFYPNTEWWTPKTDAKEVLAGSTNESFKFPQLISYAILRHQCTIPDPAPPICRIFSDCLWGELPKSGALFSLMAALEGFVKADATVFSCPRSNSEGWCGTLLGGDGNLTQSVGLLFCPVDVAAEVGHSPKYGPPSTVTNFQCIRNPQSMWCCPLHSLTFTPGTNQVSHAQITSTCQLHKGN
ncbi:hypothetical protein PGT21_020597 [Puccinia graminis f. sp. tritici]|uniref:Uncharacterized protein n=1 Tax=Puccinia graminis f. sp. tritici TaxID=56615 RepID=A0A5B0QTU2_PUCGR|nr:hypothetical protein PGT21_020597 [Puccinia graminis f. sp. tritici]